MRQLNSSYRDSHHKHEAGWRLMPGLYIALREKEGRMVSDEELLKLPEVNVFHIHQKEWRIRKKSCGHLLNYVAKKNRPLKILEIGCGNGWLSNRLAGVPKTEVTGLDINVIELKQASKVFAHRTNLSFVPGDIRDGVLGNNRFDLIVFAASVQYFSSFIEIISSAKKLLKVNGEIYITDSMFYNQKDIEMAKARSDAYFNAVGFPEMSAWYFHHPITALEYFNYKILYQPGDFLQKLFGNDDPFYRIVIKYGSH
ncbi:class I SAM-dependent methyltransferase [Flavitalea sp.]|nr:methyltransferase domain-containing protein [Flavitalea sp.]